MGSGSELPNGLVREFRLDEPLEPHLYDGVVVGGGGAGKEEVDNTQFCSFAGIYSFSPREGTDGTSLCEDTDSDDDNSSCTEEDDPEGTTGLPSEPATFGGKRNSKLLKDIQEMRTKGGHGDFLSLFLRSMLSPSLSSFDEVERDIMMTRRSWSCPWMIGISSSIDKASF